MTDEQAIEILEEAKELDDSMFQFNPSYMEALDYVIQKMRSCDDAISRQAVLDLVNCDWKYEGLESAINDLPSVNPQEQKTGHWIADVDRWGDIVTTVNGYRCDKCNTFNTDKDNYCPNCGCRMMEGGEVNGCT